MQQHIQAQDRLQTMHGNPQSHNRVCVLSCVAVLAGRQAFLKFLGCQAVGEGGTPRPKTMRVLSRVLLCLQGGKILGCQAVREGEGVDKAMDVMATLIQKQGSMYDLEEAELCYAPQYGSAKSVANIAGMVAANVLRGDHPVVHRAEVD